MMQIFDAIIYYPLYNTLIFFYNVIPGQDFGIAIILTTLLLKSLLDRKSTRLNSSHIQKSRMPSSA